MEGGAAEIADDRPDEGEARPDQERPLPDVYAMAVEEYHFQSRLGWSRTQYLLAFNAAVVVTAVGLGAQAARLASIVFGVGAVSAAISAAVVRAQYEYVRAAREHVRRVESLLGIPPEQRADPLTGRVRRTTVDRLVSLLLGLLALADLVGLVLTLVRTD